MAEGRVQRSIDGLHAGADLAGDYLTLIDITAIAAVVFEALVIVRSTVV